MLRRNNEGISFLDIISSSVGLVSEGDISIIPIRMMCLSHTWLLGLEFLSIEEFVNTNWIMHPFC